MAARKETIMMLKVDLDCSCCYKKVKKLLCSIPQIRDQTYNEKQNIVMIKVVCCSPDKIRDKLRCKGGKSIKDIQIYKPPEPEPVQQKPHPTRPVQEKPPPTRPVQKNPPSKPEPEVGGETPNSSPVGPKLDPHNPVNPTSSCCSDCREGRRTGPRYNGYGPYGYGYVYGVPPPPPPPPGGWGYYYYYGGCPPGGYRPGYCVSRCCDYISDDNPTACVIM